MKTADYWIKKLGLDPHPEGGYFREIYRAAESVDQDALPERFSGSRSFSTSIYYLLGIGTYSAFHKINQDEIWHFYDGGCLNIHIIEKNGNYSLKKLGLEAEWGQTPQIVISAGNLFAAEPAKGTDFCLAGCTVAPGFDFADFFMPDKGKLLEQFPAQKGIISRFGKQ